MRSGDIISDKAQSSGSSRYSYNGGAVQFLQLRSNENARIKIAKESNIPKAYTEVSAVQEARGNLPSSVACAVG